MKALSAIVDVQSGHVCRQVSNIAYTYQANTISHSTLWTAYHN